jgi:hypothetical protein
MLPLAGFAVDIEEFDLQFIPPQSSEEKQLRRGSDTFGKRFTETPDIHRIQEKQRRFLTENLVCGISAQHVKIPQAIEEEPLRAKREGS